MQEVLLGERRQSQGRVTTPVSEESQGVVNLVHSSGAKGDFYPMDYRLYDPDSDGKTKNDHLREMILHAVADKQIKALTVLFDSWDASVDNLKLIHRLGLIFFTTL